MGSEQVPAAGQVQDAELQQAQARLQLEGQFKSGAAWFYWIAGLSCINSLVQMEGGTWGFIVGLGITQAIDAIMKEAGGGAARTIGTVITVIIAGVFVLFGVFAQRRQAWAFYVGMTLYALDGLIFVLVGDWLGVGFHALVLYFLYRGLTAHNKLRELEAMQPVLAAP
ncbi:MAG: hypothetical protein ACRD5I_01985 [Candidatus Acidiferrales bacterium]